MMPIHSIAVNPFYFHDYVDDVDGQVMLRSKEIVKNGWNRACGARRMSCGA